MNKFKIGDKVRLLRNCGGNISVGEIGVVTRIEVEDRFIVNFPTHFGYIVGKRDIELVSERKKKSSKLGISKKKIKIEISRKDGKTLFSFEIDPSLEKMFKKQSIEIKTSGSWIGLNFYYIPAMTQDESYKDLIYRYNLIDDFGTSLYSGSKTFNVAFLRTVGGKGTIELKNDIPFAVVSDGVKRIVSFMKDYYEDFLKDYSVKGYVNFEV